MQYTEALKQEYVQLFSTMKIRPARKRQVDDVISTMLAHRDRYQAAVRQLNVPWWFVAVIHDLECSLSFNGHLHNGDPLTARTVQVPAGRPVQGSPPFTWQESAIDAIHQKGYDTVSDWSLPHVLYLLERYNGWGYRDEHPQVKSPYLWSFSQHYSKGKYIADGAWSDTQVSQQCGAATLLFGLVKRGEIPGLDPYKVLIAAEREHCEGLDHEKRVAEQHGGFAHVNQSHSINADAHRWWIWRRQRHLIDLATGRVDGQPKGWDKQYRRQRHDILVGCAGDPCSTLTDGEFDTADELQSERRIAQRAGGWDKIDAGHLARASELKAWLVDRRQDLWHKLHDEPVDHAANSAQHRRERYNAIHDLTA